MIELWTALQWFEGSVKDWQSVWTSPDILRWSALMAILLSLSVVWPVMKQRRQAAALEWRRRLAARARA